MDLSQISLNCAAGAVSGMLFAWLRGKGSFLVLRRRVAQLEDDHIHLLERFERGQKVRAGVSSSEARAANIAEAMRIAAQAQARPTNDFLPGRKN
jgi:hypothetical protein